MIERKAVRIVGPDPCDVGGIAELKWIAEYADLHGILIAPHGTGNGLLVWQRWFRSPRRSQRTTSRSDPTGKPEWWYDIVEGLPNPIVVNGFIEVSSRPGMGVDFVIHRARTYLTEEDKTFFDE